MKNFWQKLKTQKGSKPILMLAPMADVTDAPFRYMIAKYGKPDVIWTEFVSADGLILAPNDNPDENKMTSQDKLQANLKFSKIEKPIVAQLFGSNSKNMEKAARLVARQGFDGIDLNMGCPDKSIEKQGAGSAMIKNFASAQEIIRAAKRGAPQIPISVKTRLGYNSDNLEEWLKILLEEDLVAITIHARTRKEMSKVPARWERISEAVKIRNEKQKETLIFGNGDVSTLEEAQKKAQETGCDGIMIGRGIFGNPWFFSGQSPSLENKLKALIEHTELFEKDLPHKNFSIMKKHFSSYVEEFSGAKDLRIKLMTAENAKGVKKIIQNFLKENPQI